MIGEILQIAGSAVQIYGTVQQGKAAEEAGERNRAAANEYARQIERQGAEDVKVHDINAKKQIGEMKASYGASGVTLEGSPLDWLLESTEMAERDSINMKLNTIDRANAIRLGGANAYAQGVSTRDNYNLMAVGQGLGASGKVLGMAGGAGGGGGGTQLRGSGTGYYSGAEQ